MIGSSSAVKFIVFEASSFLAVLSVNIPEPLYLLTPGIASVGTSTDKVTSSVLCTIIFVRLFDA
jgi:hypothetical protein